MRYIVKMSVNLSVNLFLLLNVCAAFVVFEVRAQSIPARSRAQPSVPSVDAAAAAPAKNVTKKTETTAAAATVAKSDLRQDITFESSRPWRLARFYVVGTWKKEEAEIDWIGSNVTSPPIEFYETVCSELKDLNLEEVSLVPGASKSKEENLNLKKSTNREILLSNDSKFFGIEIPADLERDTLYLNFRSALHGKCEGRIDFRYTWVPGKSGVRPLLMLGAKQNFHVNYNVRFVVPDLRLGRLGINLDLIGGLWFAKYPNADELASTKVIYFPVTMARGEWYFPYHERLGFQLRLEQSAAAFGRTSGQSALISDYQIGMFYDVLLPVANGWVQRLNFAYRGHLLDDSTLVPTAAAPNKDAKYLMLAFSSQLFFKKYYLIGGEYSYAPKLHLAGNGVGQGYQEALFRFGFRVNASLSVLSEFGTRSYLLDGASNETISFWNGGIRLSL